MTEAAYQSRMRATATAHGLWLFRNNVGAYVAKDGRRIAYGLHKGSADCIGWRSHTVQPADVGRTLAVFVSVEFKSARGTLRPEQKRWLEIVNEAGGLAVVAREGMTWNEILEEWK
jgi:hypothetical protein